MKLAIISHTKHYKTETGDIVGWGPTINEINQLTQVFDTIYHVAMLHDNIPPSSALPYTSKQIEFVPLPPLGGSKIKDKLSIVFKAPQVLNIVKRTLRRADYFQFRAPTGIGVYVIPYLVLFSSKKGWFKYAGNWKQQNAPIAYSFQRWLLKNQKRKVTINGKWPNQHEHCLTFENPCLTKAELHTGQNIIKNKELLIAKLTFCFVGRLEQEKGLDLLITAFGNLSNDEKSNINSIHIVGSSERISFYENMAKTTGLNFVFHGFLSRSQVHEIYKISHAIVLPSASEGFPKVISEAMNYGCLPVVSNISSISNYVHDNVNGFLFYPITQEGLIQVLRKVLKLKNDEYSILIQSKAQEIFKFTYQHYNSRIIQRIVNELPDNQ